MSLFDLTGFQRDLLYVVASLNQPSGQVIKERMEEETGIDVNHGRLYPNLDTLVEKGLVTKGEIDRRTNYYMLSDKGKQALVERREWEEEFF